MRFGSTKVQPIRGLPNFAFDFFLSLAQTPWSQLLKNSQQLTCPEFLGETAELSKEKRPLLTNSGRLTAEHSNQNTQ
ncbi:hypothetical protein Q5H92_10140 [Hymenobacter sp. M29]|uniref:Uncharacterized protein n=1 Tax=Hymenobacter mellowenesis TaxID=3063995 RepID=A0ABT9AA54_9BACT|nr:hypothetical protein [Hymenobacter sp. M29]MDO7846716.1 hypothetical protein [Hymenobacter sp. M29]